MPSFAVKTFRNAALKLKTDQRGIAAVEFALILPFLLILLIGMSETVTALNTDRKVSQIASSVADLVAQAETVSTDEISDIMLAAEQIMLPYSDTPLDVIIASVTFDDEGNPEVDWSRNKSGGTPWAAGSTPPIEIPDAISVAGNSLIVGKSTYTYEPLFSTLAQNLFPRSTSIELEDTYYLKPRLTTTVTLTGN